MRMQVECRHYLSECELGEWIVGEWAVIVAVVVVGTDRLLGLIHT
jgi:hypothetical protein